jgi:hypothetical protein
MKMGRGLIGSGYCLLEIFSLEDKGSMFLRIVNVCLQVHRRHNSEDQHDVFTVVRTSDLIK